MSWYTLLKNFNRKKTDLNLFGLLQRSQSNDIFGIQDVQSFSPMSNVISLHDSPDSRYNPMHEFEFLGRCPLPTNFKEVETQSHGINFNFLQSLDFDNIESEAINSLSAANSFWNITDVNFQLKNFLDGWLYDKKFNNRYCFGFVDSLIELMCIRERMLAAKKYEC